MKKMNTAISMGNCPRCCSSEVRKLASVYSAGLGGVTTEKAESFSGARASGVAIVADPPQTMANSTGWPLSILLWTPIIWLFILVAIQHSVAGRSWGETTTAGSVALLSAALVAFAAWSVPAWLQRRKADGYNGEVWGPAMKDWHEASVCLNCCKVYV
jgi:hypothetical protein